MATWLESARDWDPETAPSWLDQLRSDGIQVPSPETVLAGDLPDVLGVLIKALSERHVYLCHTNHLDDAALYAYLVNTALAVTALPRQPTAYEVIDLCPLYGKGIDTMLACHASDSLRASLQALGVDVPPRRALIANRDQWLPRPEGINIPL
ncbi:MAG: hypothetical protein P8I91_05080 [Phycisphaerales bacterium]|nr:hypothetical protein [Phycisphaerales bacterium]